MGAQKQMFPHHKSNGSILKFKSMDNPKQLFLVAKVMRVFINMGNTIKYLLLISLLTYYLIPTIYYLAYLIN